MVTEQDLENKLDKEMQRWDFDRQIGYLHESPITPHCQHSYIENLFFGMYGKYPTDTEIEQFIKNRKRPVMWRNKKEEEDL
jgi:hypothetical protein